MPSFNYDGQVKKFSSNMLGRKTAQKNDGTEGAGSGVRKYQIYCNKRHSLYLTREEFYRTIVRGHVITTLRIHEFTAFGFEKKTDVGEKYGANQI